MKEKTKVKYVVRNMNQVNPDHGALHFDHVSDARDWFYNHKLMFPKLAISRRTTKTTITDLDVTPK